MGNVSAFPRRAGAAKSTGPRAPKHLSKAAKQWFSHVLSEYDVSRTELEIVIGAAEALDRAREAREGIETTGAVVKDRFGQDKPSPWVAIERDSKLLFARLVRQLGIDAEEGGRKEIRPVELRRSR